MNLHAGPTHLHFVEHGLREVPGLLTDSHEVCCRNYCFENWHDKSISSCAIPHANIPPADIFLENIRYVIGRQTAQHFRWEFLSHFRYSPAAAQPEVQSSRISTQLESEFDSASQSSYLSSPESARDQYGTDRKNKNDCTNLVICWRH